MTYFFFCTYIKNIFKYNKYEVKGSMFYSFTFSLLLFLFKKGLTTDLTF